MLTRLFGEDFAERLIANVLFDLPVTLAAEQGDCTRISRVD